MFFELIATFAAGVGAAGIALILNRLTGRRLPGGIVPVAAGIAMLGYAVWSEMTWADRTTAALPEGIEVVEVIEERIFWKPWTYISPQASRFVAVDRANSRENSQVPGTLMVDLYFHARWQPVARISQLVNCQTSARADVTETAIASPNEVKNWISLGKDDPLILTLCAT